MALAPSIIINLPGYPFENFPSLATIDDLRAIASSGLKDGDNYVIDGGSAVGDGSGGVYAWNDGLVANDDGDTVIKPNDTSSGSAGRWVLTGRGPFDALGGPTGANVPGFSHAQTYNQGTVGLALQDYINLANAPYNAVPGGNITAAWNAAAATGRAIAIPEGTYYASGLTSGADGQCFYGLGNVRIQKSGNGPLFSAANSYLQFHGIVFVGDGFTGHNVVTTGNHLSMINCGSQGAAGRALLAQGSHTTIIGSKTVYQTTDATATGYDIELGISGTATLYHLLVGIYSSQPTGGIKLVDTGSHSISGGQFGKLTIAAGTKPIGSNGGMTTNARILGDVLVGLSNATFTGNQFSTQTITFEAATSGHSMDQSNIVSVATIVNNSSSGSTIIASVGTGSPTGIILDYGGTGNCRVRYVPNGDIYFPGNIILPNNVSLNGVDSGGVNRSLITLSAGDDLQVGGGVNGANFTAVAGGTLGVFNQIAGASIIQTVATALRPVADNTISCGGASNRWSVVYAGTGTINTSDERSKQQVRELSEAEHAVAIRCKGLLRAFKFNDAVAEKGEGARWHFGAIAQDVAEAFESEGLDPHAYGLFCHDEWSEQEEVWTAAAYDDEGNEIEPARLMVPYRPAGDRYGIRYEEFLAFIVGAI